jgi:hypothetical protein
MHSRSSLSPSSSMHSRARGVAPHEARGDADRLELAHCHWKQARQQPEATRVCRSHYTRHRRDVRKQHAEARRSIPIQIEVCTTPPSMTLSVARAKPIAASLLANTRDRWSLERRSVGGPRLLLPFAQPYCPSLSMTSAWVDHAVDERGGGGCAEEAHHAVSRYFSIAGLTRLTSSSREGATSTGTPMM